MEASAGLSYENSMGELLRQWLEHVGEAALARNSVFGCGSE